jgi:hypothetical protein
MKLPEIEDTTPVEDVSSGYGRMAQAQAQASSVFEQGLSAYGQELIKSQHNRAAADLLGGLESTQIDLRSRKTISTQELRDELGPDFDKLPPEIKDQTTKRGLNRETYEPETQDRDDIPMFAVAGSIFDSRAKRLLAASTSKFSSSGWAARFQDDAQHEILQQKMALSRHTMEDMHNYLQEEDTKSAIDLANSGQFDAARQVVKGSRTMDLKHATDLNDHIEKIEQTRPIYEALRTGNIADMAKMLPALGDEGQFTKLNPEERQSFTHRLESEIDAFQRGVKQAGEDKLKANAEAGWNDIFTKERAGASIDYRDIPMPGTVHATAQKEMIEYVDKLNKGERPETDMTLYAGLTDLATKDRQKFSSTNLLNYRNRLSDADFKHFIDLQTGLRGGNPEAYDHFQTTDEAINAQLIDPKYGIDVHDKQNTTIQQKVGYVKTLVQHELAIAQEANGGKPLSLEDRDGVIQSTLKANIDQRKDRWGGVLGKAPSTVLGMEAGVDAAAASTFQKAVNSLDPASMASLDSSAKVKALKKHYEDYQSFEPMIETAWNIQHGKNISPDDAVRVWYWTKSNYQRLEGLLRSGGGYTAGDDATNRERIVNLAVQEVLRKLGR